MPSLFLGRNQLYWCKSCNLPIIDNKRCPNPDCNENTFLVKISPPYDCRPAFKHDIIRMKNTIRSQFGTDCEQIIDENKVIILNKVAYEDRMDEVVIDGKIIGNIRFNVLLSCEDKWEFIPKLEGARRLHKFNPRSWVIADEGAVKPIIKGANLLAPGVIDFSKDIKKGDYTLILTKNKEVLGLGISNFSSNEIPKHKRGVTIKLNYSEIPKSAEILEGGQNWDTAVKINEKFLASKEESLIRYINHVSKKFELPNLVSFSGGKDSLVTFLLVLKSGIDFKIFFIDTGIEFKETIEFVEYIVKEYNLEEKFMKYTTKNDFYEESRSNFGPPARDFRWCCKVLKLSNINDLIRDHFPKGVLTFIGNRKYESFLRRDDSKKGKISKNSYIPQQINVNIINSWIALTVWLYIFREQKLNGIKMNPLYELGYERVGCLPCPANKLADIDILRQHFPDEYQKLITMLEYHAEKNEYPKEWVSLGLWRWKKLPKSQINLLEKLKIEPIKAKYGTSDKLEIKFTKGISPCQDGSLLLEGSLSEGLDLERIANFLAQYGKIMLNVENGIMNVKKDMTLVNIFSDGSLNIRTYENDDSILIETLKDIIPFILKAQKCIGCGICIEMCPSKAIFMKDKKAWIDEKKCNSCIKCLKKCPILDYSFKDILKEI